MMGLALGPQCRVGYGVGSRERTHAIVRNLGRDTFPDEDTEAVHIGLLGVAFLSNDLGGQPLQIARR